MEGREDGLRILVMPMPNTRSFLNNGIFLAIRDLMDHVEVKAKGKIFFYLYVPDFAEEETKNDPRYSKMLVGSFPTIPDRMDYPYLLPVMDLYRLFNRRSGTYPIDAAFTDDVGSALMLNRILSDAKRIKKTEEFPIFILEGGVMLSRVREDNREGIEYVCEALGYSVGNPIFLTKREQDLARRMMSLYLSPSQVNKALTKSLVSPLAVKCDEVDKAIAGVEKNPRFTVFFGGRLNDSKRIEEILTSYDYLFRFGRPIDIVITTGNASTSFVNPGDYPHVKFMMNCGREDYWREAAKSHVFVCASPEEGFPVGFFEQLYAGVVGLFQDYPWVRGCLPENYPFIYESEIDRDVMLREVYNDYPAAKKKVEWVPQWIREHFRPDVVLDGMWTFMRKACDEKKKIFWGKSFKDLVLKACTELGDGFTLDQLYAKMADFAESKAAFNSAGLIRSRVPGRWEIKQLAFDAGWHDECSGLDPVFRK